MQMENAFDDLWKECIVAHYVAAARTNVNIEGANTVMKKAGYKQGDIDQLYISATMHQDDLAPNVEINRSYAEAVMKQHEKDCSCIQCAPTAPVAPQQIPVATKKPFGKPFKK